MTNREYIISKLNSGRTLRRMTANGSMIRYTNTNKGVYRCEIRASDGISSSGKYITMTAAITQLVRNFRQIY